MSPDDIVAKIKMVLSKSEINLITSKKKCFSGLINTNHFNLYRLKRFGHFDYGVTKFSGDISEADGITKLTGKFSLSWIYVNLLFVTVLLLILFNLLLLNYETARTWEVLIFLPFEILVVFRMYYQRKSRFKKDKKRYVLLFKELFEEMELKQIKNHC